MFYLRERNCVCVRERSHFVRVCVSFREREREREYKTIFFSNFRDQVQSLWNNDIDLQTEQFIFKQSVNKTQKDVVILTTSTTDVHTTQFWVLWWLKVVGVGWLRSDYSQ